MLMQHRNNYLAKPVRANTLKQLLESYLSQDPKPMPNLQHEAKQIAKEVLCNDVDQESTPTSDVAEKAKLHHQRTSTAQLRPAEQKVNGDKEEGKENLKENHEGG